MRKCLLELRTKRIRHIIISSAVRCVYKSTYDWWCFPEHFRRHFFSSVRRILSLLVNMKLNSYFGRAFSLIVRKWSEAKWSVCAVHVLGIVVSMTHFFLFVPTFDCDYIYKRLQSLCVLLGVLFRRIAEKMYAGRVPRMVIERWQWQNCFGSYAPWSIEEIKNIIANMSTGRTVCRNNVSIKRFYFFLFLPRFHKNTINDRDFGVFSHSIKCVVLCEEQTHLYA